MIAFTVTFFIIAFILFVYTTYQIYLLGEEIWFDIGTLFTDMLAAIRALADVVIILAKLIDQTFSDPIGVIRTFIVQLFRLLADVIVDILKYILEAIFGVGFVIRGAQVC